MMKGTMHDVFWGVLLICALFVVTSGHAQSKKYPYVQDGRTIVCREGNNGVKSSLIHPNWTTTPEHDESSSEYNLLAKRFEVASWDARKGDNSTSMTWYEACGVYDEKYNSNAYSACANYSQEGSSDKGLWRLPTIRELRLIYALRNELDVHFYISNDLSYWSATGGSFLSLESVYSVAFYNGRQQVWDKSYDSVYVRCVRDL